MGEVTAEPPVALLDEVDEDPEEEEGEEDYAGAVVPAAFHYRMHFFFVFLK